jgi:hypothetical protein
MPAIMRHGACYTISLKHKTTMNLFNLPDPEDTEDVSADETTGLVDSDEDIDLKTRISHWMKTTRLKLSIRTMPKTMKFSKKAVL